MTTPNDLVTRQIMRSGETLILAMEPLPDSLFFRENQDGFSAAWTVGHLACVADLFSSWFDDGALLLDEGFHRVFNETSVTAPGPLSKAVAVERENYGKQELLLRFRQAVVKALTVLSRFDQWDAPPPRGVPATLTTGGSVWEILAAHIYWHCGALAGSMDAFFDTYTLNILPHHLYVGT
jgi:anti-sigma factor RsiW